MVIRSAGKKIPKKGLTSSFVLLAPVFILGGVMVRNGSCAETEATGEEDDIGRGIDAGCE
jgi:hypothetical protein